MEEFKSLKVFSKKLDELVDTIFVNEGCFKVINNAFWSDSGWNNFGNSWLDNGWNNFGNSWMDNGWNNFGDSWMDNGWNNFGNSWMDNGWNNFG